MVFGRQTIERNRAGAGVKSRKGNATVEPTPRKKVRLPICLPVINFMLSLASSVDLLFAQGHFDTCSGPLHLKSVTFYDPKDKR